MVQLSVLLLVAQSKFNPSKCEIHLLHEISFLTYSAGAVAYAVLCLSCSSNKTA